MIHLAGARRALLQLTNPTLLRERCYIDGTWVGVEGGPRVPVINPATGDVIATVPWLDVAHARQAVAAAKAAIPTWAARPARERATILHRWSALILANLEDLAYLVTMEQGKPLAAAMREIAFAASLVQHLADAAKRVDAERVPARGSDRRRLTLLHPMGVCAAFASWHFPFSMIARMATAPLAAGCAVILRPAPQTPLSALAAAALAEAAGVPHGTLNIVTGPAGAIAREFAANTVVRKLTFGGACEIGRRLLRTRPDAVEKITIGRGRAAVLIFDDANVDAAVHSALCSTFRNDGQHVPASRLLIQRGIYGVFATQYVAAVRALKVGPGIEPQTEIGPLIDAAALHRVERQIADACSQGATLATGGQRHARGGLFFEPTVLYHMTPGMLNGLTDSSGLVVPLILFNNEAEALAMANQCEANPATYLFTRDVGRVYRVAQGLRTGILGVSTGGLPSEGGPFSEPRPSASGLNGGDDEIRAYLQVKNVCFVESSRHPPLSG